MSTPEELDAAWINGPPSPSGPIVVVEYDPQWPAMYEREQARIRRLVGGAVVSIEHIGSTSVPGLVAKPVIDIGLTVADSADESSYVPQLESARYRLIIREPNWHEHRCLKGPDTNVNLHVFSPGSPEATRHIVFRDWLRAHEEDRDLYGRTKQSLADGTMHDMRVQRRQGRRDRRGIRQGLRLVT